MRRPPERAQKSSALTTKAGSSLLVSWTWFLRSALRWLR
jgi:hypothetical protein